MLVQVKLFAGVDVVIFRFEDWLSLDLEIKKKMDGDQIVIAVE